MSSKSNVELQFRERRKFERLPVEIGANAIMANSETSFDCTILDLSEGGAKVEIPEIDIIPVQFMLYVPETDQIYACKVVWRKDAFLGLQFVDDARV
ncbi:MAG: hypothetical protein GKR97_20390 [Rhizobiaceae bacterium]|nr:hypothetical protein [Rhizobiaceae bacterium]